jgi:HEAT repeat protein
MTTSPTPWLRALESPDAALRKEASLWLGGLSPNEDVEVAPLAEALNSMNETVSFWAAIALGCLGSRAGQAVAPLSATAQHHSAFGVRQACIAALGKVALLDDVARSSIFRALSDPSPFVQREALQGIATLKVLGHGERKLVADLESDPDEAVSEWAKIALSRTRTDA